MRLQTPQMAPRVRMTDIKGRPILLGGSGRRTLVCFFRDAACPFCNLHIYRLTSRHDELKRLGVDVVALFCSTPEEVQRFVSRHDRPFPVIADAESRAYDLYRVERSTLRKIKAIVTRIPSLLRGLRIVGLSGLFTNNVVPTDFLIDEDGRIAEAHYGIDAGDHIPFERIEAFAAAARSRENDPGTMQGALRQAARQSAQPKV